MEFETKAIRFPNPAPRTLPQLLLLLLLPLLWVQPCGAQCCLKFVNAQCVQCPADTRLVNGNCLLNLPRCAEYNLFDCVRCDAGYILDQDRKCTSLRNYPPYTEQATPTSYFFLSE